MLPAFSPYGFGLWNQSNLPEPTWALLDAATIGIECIVAEFGQRPTLTSGYRSPSDQVRIDSDHVVSNWNNSYHIRGLAADLDTPNGSKGTPVQEWRDLEEIVRVVGAGADSSSHGIGRQIIFMSIFVHQVSSRSQASLVLVRRPCGQSW
jgi:hypothetical protein